MSSLTGFLANGGKFSSFTGRLRILLMRYPEWWVWFFSLFVWILLFMQPFIASDKGEQSGHLLYCMTAEMTPVTAHPSNEIQTILKETSVSSKVASTISNGLIPWIIMVVAMMFPLLNEPVRHVAFSVRQKDRDLGISWFLIGYTVIWTLAGVLFLLLPVVLNHAVGERTALVNGLINVSGFLLAAIIVWLPNRPLAMIRCSETIPIRIQGWQLHTDSLTYGLKMGFACLRMCWAPMAALMLVHHGVILMLVATAIIVYERYRLPHTSKLPGYAWGVIAFTLLGIEIGKQIF